MSTPDDRSDRGDRNAAAPAPSLVDSVRAFVDGVPEAERPDALHELFYGFYARVAIADQTTHRLAQWARQEIGEIADLPPSLAEALRDNALHVGRELFATRIRTMSAMGYVSAQLSELRDSIGDRPFALQRAVAFDEDSGEMRSYDLSRPGEHPDLPYDPFSYDPQAEDA
ncbi:MAG: hypothetical protein JWO02_1584 [Solirubrobacterales bacterium]|nr:hypothetical protein [Solirubrobacterales bacterium]